MYCQQVTVQSNTDVSVRKMTRREQKRAARQLSKITQNMDEDEKLALERAQEDMLKARYVFLRELVCKEMAAKIVIIVRIIFIFIAIFIIIIRH